MIPRERFPCLMAGQGQRPPEVSGKKARTSWSESIVTEQGVAAEEQEDGDSQGQSAGT